MAISHVEYFAERDAAGVANPTLAVTGVSWAAGDLIAVIVTAKDNSATACSASATGLTFAQQRWAADTQGQVRVGYAIATAGGAGSGVTVTATITDASLAGGFQATVLVISGNSPAIDVDNDANTGASDTTAPSCNITTVAASTRIYCFINARIRTVTLDGAQTAIRATDTTVGLSASGSEAGTTSGYRDVASASTYTLSGTISPAFDWIELVFAVKETSGGGAALAGSWAGVGAWGASALVIAGGQPLAGSEAGVGAWGASGLVVAGGQPLAGAWAGVGAWSANLTPHPGATLAGSWAGVALWAAGLTAPGPPGPASPMAEYVVEMFNSDGSFGPSSKLGEVWDARNIGWSRFDRIPGKAFFTLPQTSSLLALLVPLTTHIAIQRINTDGTITQVFAGVVVDFDSTGDDVVVSCFDYLSLLSISRTGYKTMYPTKLVGSEIVSPEWVLGKTAANSPLGFVTSGTIEDPLGTDGTTPIKTNNQFGLLDQMRLQLFYDLSEIGRANTVNQVTFHISRISPYTFTFLKNAGAQRDIGLVLGGNVDDYRHVPGWRGFRNDLATIGTTIGGGATEVVSTDASGTLTTKGRRQDVFTLKTLLGIVGKATEADQQKAAADRALKTAVQLQPVLLLRLVRGALVPFGGWDIGDKMPVEISNGIDNIATSWRVVGTRTIIDEAGESPSLLVVPVAS